jgi:hypothetical protein
MAEQATPVIGNWRPVERATRAQLDPCFTMSNTLGTARLRVSNGPSGGGNTVNEVDVARFSGPSSIRFVPMAVASTALTRAIVWGLVLLKRAGCGPTLVAHPMFKRLIVALPKATTTRENVPVIVVPLYGLSCHDYSQTPLLVAS